MLPASLRRALEEAASHWGVSSQMALWLFAIPVIGSALIIPVRISYKAWTLLTSEDRILEWAQFGLFAIAAVVAIWIAVARFRAGARWQGALFLLFGLALLFIAGEEISWGQRIFGFATPDELEDLNEQGETTFHNLVGALASINVLMFLIGVVGSLLPFLDRRYHWSERIGHGVEVFVPPVFLSTAFAVVALFRLARATFLRGHSFTFGQYGEWSEFCLALAFAIYVILVLRRVRGSGGAPVTA